MFILIVCMGGIVYNILNGTPFAKYDRDGNIVEFISTGQRDQYAGEGVLMSSLFVLGGTLLYNKNNILVWKYIFILHINHIKNGFVFLFVKKVKIKIIIIQILQNV